MAKKKKSQKWPADELPEGTVFMVQDDLAEMQEVAFFMTNLISTINPSVDKAATFEIVCEMLNQGTGEGVAEFYGNLIRATGGNSKVGVH